MMFTSEQINTLTPQQYSRWQDLCDMLSAAGVSCGGIFNRALREYQNPYYKQNEKADMEAKLKTYHAGLSDLKEISEQVSAVLQLGSIQTLAQYKGLSEMCSQLSTAIRIPTAVLKCKDLSVREEKISFVCACGHRRDAVKEEICAMFSEQLLSFDAETALLQWNQAEASWFLPKMLGESKIAKSIRLYALDKKGYNKTDTPKFLELISEYHKNVDAIKNSAALFNDLFGTIFDSGDCDWSLIENITMIAVNLHKTVKAIALEEICESAAIKFLSEALDQNYERFTRENQSKWNRLVELVVELIELENALSEQFKNPFDQWHIESDWVSSMKEKSSRWIANIGGLRDYCGYLQVKAELDAEGLQTIYAALESGTVKEKELKGSFIKSSSKSCAFQIIDNTPTLNSFHGNLFSQKIEKYKAITEQYETLTKQELAARLSAQIPVLNTGVSGSSEIGILQRAIKSGGRMMPIRKLFENIAGIILAIVMTMELLQLVMEKNNMHDFETWLFFKWIFKTFCAVLIVTNTWNIIMGVFDLAQSVVNSAAGIIVSDTSIDINDVVTNMEARLMEMEVGPLLWLWFQTLFVGLTMWALSICIFVIVYGRMIEVYLVTSVAPLPMATMMNKEWGQMGQNYLRSLFALGFQAFLIIVCVAVYAVLVQSIAIESDVSAAIWTCIGYMVLLCFTLFKTGGLAKAVFNAH